ncbi:hypothetical protein [Photobacterium kishitanii]|uniref:Uncharacterized protein n=1 Tax=Photobacterium kishitanii TaxID=318456 RepID=A0A2T3KM15_9GAMM|nr:hypothetical protein [Photobacterium kishitanii]PSV00738.1 hypothetical protein C9J27_06240 [Photobacterium kishitanii]
MEFLTGAIIGGVVYDMVKYNIATTVGFIGMKIKDMLGIDEKVSFAVATELAKLDYSSCNGEKDKIIEMINSNGSVQSALNELNGKGANNSVNNVNIQNNSGQVITGSSIAGGITLNASDNCAK